MCIRHTPNMHSNIWALILTCVTNLWPRFLEYGGHHDACDLVQGISGGILADFASLNVSFCPSLDTNSRPASARSLACGRRETDMSRSSVFSVCARNSIPWYFLTNNLNLFTAVSDCAQVLDTEPPSPHSTYLSPYGSLCIGKGLNGCQGCAG